jgi:hypothetical protein
MVVVVAAVAEAADSSHISDAGYCRRPLALLYSHHLGRTVPIFLSVISPLVPVIGVIELPGSIGIVAVVPLSLPLSL